jgi:MFS family permease
MFNDSDIISYSLYSLENGTSELLNKNKYYKPNSNGHANKNLKKTQSSNSLVTFSIHSSKNNSSDTFNKNNKKLAFLKRELKTFCCFICFITRFKFHSLKIYLTLICLMALFTQMIQGGYISAIITSVQNHFNLSTSKVGYILSSYDIMSVFATPIISYIGSRFNKARIIGICGFSYVIGAVVFILPYYLGPKYSVNIVTTNKDFNTSSNGLCLVQSNTNGNVEFVSNETTILFLTTTTTPTSTISCHRDFSYTWPFYVFIASQLLMSIGVAPLFSLGTTYLCDNSEERLHAFYTGILYAFYALGPAIGYLIASYFLSKWINHFQELAPINDSDPRWVGLWYLGFLISAGGILVISILMLTFPEHLKEKARKLKKKKDKISESNSSTTNTNRIFGNNEVAIDFNSNNKRKLDTIDEVSEIVDKNFEFLDSISSRVDDTIINNNPQPNINANLVVPNDSISTQFYQNSYSSGSSVLNKMASETSSVAIVGNKKLRNTLSASISHKIVHTKLKLNGFLNSLLKLFLNYRYTILILVISTDCVLLSAFTNYMILYSQNVYQLSSSKSSILVGGVIVPAAIVGAVLGGFIVRKFNLDIEGCTRLIMISSILVLGGIFALIFFKCDSIASAGIDSINNGYI